MNADRMITVSNLLAAGYISSPPLSIEVHDTSYHLRDRQSHTPQHEIQHYKPKTHNGRPVPESFCVKITLDHRNRYTRDYLVDFADLYNALNCASQIKTYSIQRP
jgi:hypothetical protein